jgi:hypothetical protein
MVGANLMRDIASAIAILMWVAALVGMVGWWWCRRSK